MCEIWRPPFGGGPRPMAPMAPIDKKALAQHQENVSAPKKLFDPPNFLAQVDFNLVRYINKLSL